MVSSGQTTSAARSVARIASRSASSEILLATGRRRRHLKPTLWRAVDLGRGQVIVVGAVVHAIPIEGTKGTVSTAALAAPVLGAVVGGILPLFHRGLPARCSPGSPEPACGRTPSLRVDNRAR